MRVDVEDHAGIKVLRLHGELIDEHGDFVATATGLLGGRGTRIVVDLADVPFMNSTGLAALVRVTAQANVQESRVVLARPTPFVAGVLQTTQLDRFFEIYPTVEAALGKLR